MKNKIRRAKTFLEDHKTDIAFVAGAAVAISGMYLYTRNKTLLEVTQDQIDDMRDHECDVFYTSKRGPKFRLSIIPDN